MSSHEALPAGTVPLLELPASVDRLALFLDVDGTLLEIAPTPDAVSVPAGLVPLLIDLCHRLDGALALLSGRPLAQLDTLLAPFRPAAAGVHGAELRGVDGLVLEALPSPPLDPALRRRLAAELAALPGVQLEDKGSAIACHYRAAPQAEAGVKALARAAQQAHPELAVLEGRMVVELRRAGADKGRALNALMETPPFAGRMPIAVGDDVTDLDAFRAAEALGGRGLAVGTALAPGRPCVFAGPAAVLAWLDGLARAKDGETR